MKIFKQKYILLIIITLSLNQNILAQTTKVQKDSTHWHNLKDVTIVGRNSKSDYQQIPEIVGTNIYAGKKNRKIRLHTSELLRKSFSAPH